MTASRLRWRTMTRSAASRLAALCAAVVAVAGAVAVPAAAAGTVPSKTVPSKTVPSKTVPSKTVPAKTVPAKQAVAAGTGGAVASDDVQATQAGIGVLRHGGNAVDAAVAVAATLGVTDPFVAGIGG